MSPLPSEGQRVGRSHPDTNDAAGRDGERSDHPDCGQVALGVRDAPAPTLPKTCLPVEDA